MHGDDDGDDDDNDDEDDDDDDENDGGGDDDGGDDDDDEDDADADDGSSAVGPGLQDNADFAISFCFYCFKTPLSQFSKSKIFRWEVLV